MDLGGEGRVVLEPVPDQPGIVELRFSQPFAYAGGERDMVVEIHNGGVTFGYEHQSWGGLDVLGAQHGEAGKARRTVAFEDGGGRRVASSFVLRYMLRVADNPPIVTRWYRIDDAENPQFITNKNDAYGTADPLDYSLQYQAGTAVLDEAGHPKMRLDGTPDCTATGLWRSRPPAGAKAVRVRIRFDDRWYPSGQEPPEIEYILVRYKEG